MSMNLNLLPSQAKFQAFKVKIKKKVVVFIWGLCITWFSVTLVIFGFWFVAQTSLKREEKLYNRELEAYKSLSERVVLSEQIKYRAKLVGEVLGQRFEYGDAINRVNNLFSENITLNDFSLSNNDKFDIVGFALGSNINEVEEKLGSINTGKIEEFKSAKINTLSLAGSEWKFGMEVLLK